jgi:lipopolysaccharide/colanic/teichoic acid biosynthesis glycosyltransferase
MSLVGPRPEVPRYVALYTLEQRAVLELIPGITDLASIEYRDEEQVLASYDDPLDAYIRIVMPDKIRINLAYASRASVLDDVHVLARTALAVLRLRRDAMPATCRSRA